MLAVTSGRRSSFLEPVRFLHSRMTPYITALGALAICTAVALRDPREEGSFGVCPWLFVTGTHCPGCGVLRTLNRVVGGDIIGAFRYNLLVALSIPVLIYAWFRWALPEKISNSLPRIALVSPKAPYVLVLVIATFWVTRNLPWQPFNWLAPIDS